jgi:hypothetical protein
VTDLSALIARLEQGSREDRELDGELMFTAFARPAGPTGYLWPEDNPSWSFAIRFPGKDREWFDKCRGPDRETIVIWRDGDPILMNSLRVRPLTSSLDAALAFTESAAPEWTVHDIHHGKRLWTVHICRRGDAMTEVDGEHESFARAVLIATLKALEAKSHD